MAQELLTALTGAYDRPIDNPYGIGANALAQSMPLLVNPYGSVGGNFAAVAGAGLLSGLLGYFARQDAQETNARIAGLQSQFLAPTATDAQRSALVAQEPRLSALQNALLANKLNLQQIRNEEEQKALGKAAGDIAVLNKKLPDEQQAAEVAAINDALKSGQTTYASPKTGEIKPVPIADGAIGKITKPADIRAEEDAARTEINKLPSVLQFQSMQKALPLVKAFKDENTKSSDMGFVYNYVKANDDGAVRGEEINMAQSTNPLINKYKALIQGAIDGTSELTPALKNQMYNELLSAQKNVYEQAKLDATIRANIAKERGVSNISNVYPFKFDMNFDDNSTATGGYTIEQKAAALELLNKRLGK